jgi:hypothetical protein
VDGGDPAGHLAELGESVLRSGEADLEAFDLTGPAFMFGFGDPGEQVVADVEDAGPWGWGRPEQGTSQATVFVDAGCRVGAAAIAKGGPAAFEVAEKLLPLLLHYTGAVKNARKSVDDVVLATLGWVSWYSTTRLHGTLDDLPPVEYEAAYHHQTETNHRLEPNEPSLHRTAGVRQSRPTRPPGAVSLTP